MNDHDDLLRAIAANPDEDTPRLVYADFLDELGGESRTARAEFIRLHTRAERLALDDPEREAAKPRISQLLCAWDTVWQQEMPPGWKALAYHRRGFPFRGAVTASQVEDDDDPRPHLLEYVELTPDVPPHRLSEILRRSIGPWVKTLIVRSPLPWSAVYGALAEADYGLLRSAGAEALASGDYQRLECLDIARHAIGDEGFRALCESWGFPQLRELNLNNNNITDFGIATLIRSNLLPQLRRLELSDNPISVAMRDRVRPGHGES